MKKFTYIDYLRYKSEEERDFNSILELYKILNKKENLDISINSLSKPIMTLNENVLEYEYLDKNHTLQDTNQVHDKTYRTILLNKKELPVIYPIVLYTGNKKWNQKKFLEDCQVRLPGCSQKPFTNYTIIDINDYTESELLKKSGLLPKIMLLEKSKNEQNLLDNLEKVADLDLSEEQKIC